MLLTGTDELQYYSDDTDTAQVNRPMNDCVALAKLTAVFRQDVTDMLPYAAAQQQAAAVREAVLHALDVAYARVSERREGRYCFALDAPFASPGVQLYRD